jgi:hypothetical protein
MYLALTINGKLHDLDIEPEMPLLWALREQLQLTGTKYACGIAQCGACTVPGTNRIPFRWHGPKPVFHYGVPHTEMGQGDLTSVAMMIAEELNVDDGVRGARQDLQ